ncbi:MAG TPA: class I SAM-dependent methyltransferase [Terriglobales bacterium]|nr:class I SAM-dependent methyltransferase [Terriglobales bacterium]
MISVDWRIANVERLRGETFVKKPYLAPSPEWDHDHCSACWKRFSEGEDPGVEHIGYATTESYRYGADYEWVCIECFDDLRQALRWSEVKGEYSKDSTTLTNCYQDLIRAKAYDQLQFAGTYLLAYRDLPELFAQHVSGTKALDFGCGTGRSARFLKRNGFEVVGVDISPEMLERARQHDPEGDYRLVGDGDLSALASDEGTFDLVLSMFTFDNIPAENKVPLFTELRQLLNPTGRLISVVSAPQIYWHEWASFSTKEFAEANRLAKSGEKVKIIVTDHTDQRPVEDIVWTHEAYSEVYEKAGLEIVEMKKPLATGDEPYEWVNETEIAPWVVYVLRPV